MLSLTDESVKIFLNTRGTMDDVDEEMKKFLAYVEDTRIALPRGQRAR